MSVRGMQVGSAAMAAAALLAACSGQSENQPQSVATAPSTTLLPTPPPPSATASETAASGSVSPRDQVRAVSVQFYEAVERAYLSADAGQLQALSSPRCGGCAGQIKYIREIASDQHRHRDGEFTTKVQSVEVQDGAGSARVEVAFSGASIVDSRGRVVRRVQPVAELQQLNLKRVDGRWIVDEILGLK